MTLKDVVRTHSQPLKIQNLIDVNFHREFSIEEKYGICAETRYFSISNNFLILF